MLCFWYNTDMDLKAIRISEKKQAILAQMYIDSVEQLLQHYPFRYEENRVKPFLEWEEKERVCFEGEVISVARTNRYAYKKSVTSFDVLYDAQVIRVSIFNRPWTSAFKLHTKLTFFGRYDGYNKVSLISYTSESLQQHLGIIPVYNIKEGISQKDIRKYMQKALQASLFDEFIPAYLRDKYMLQSRKDALYGIHSPNNKESLKQSLRYLKYEEFLKFQLQMQQRKMDGMKVGIAKQFSQDKIDAFIHSLGYTLTQGQSSAIQDVLQDLQSNQCMYRLVQGDVGCGKTLVACISMYANVLSTSQCAFMAPTEILAIQHYENLKKYFDAYDIRIALLTSSIKKKDRVLLLEQLQTGEIDILVGTHALFQEDVHFSNLGMVVADEQHRFGVQQRRKLLEKGSKVDFLLMSATPIPRTLAVSLFGDMDVSSIEELPLGRKGVTTQFVNEDSMRSIFQDVLQKMEQGNQMYVVCPAIANNEEYAMRNVEQLYDSMQQVLSNKFNIALLHGKMTPSEKQCIMDDFKSYKYDILISTTVIEVGVDVKDANIMVIYDAHRFGMSQLHQLRGRVGRGDKPGYCYLLSATKDAQSMKRLELMQSCSDGFEIAKADLSLRGSGDLLGVRQSGVPSFILGDIINDFNILETARNDAITLLKNISKEPQVLSFLQDVEYSEYID